MTRMKLWARAAMQQQDDDAADPAPGNGIERIARLVEETIAIGVHPRVIREILSEARDPAASGAEPP